MSSTILFVSMFIIVLKYIFSFRNPKYTRNASDHPRIAQYWKANRRPLTDRVRQECCPRHHHLLLTVAAIGLPAQDRWLSDAIRCRPARNQLPTPTIRALALLPKRLIFYKGLLRYSRAAKRRRQRQHNTQTQRRRYPSSSFPR